MEADVAPGTLAAQPYEHHSNILPWRESTALVVEVREDAGGGIDQEHLAELLRVSPPPFPFPIPIPSTPSFRM